MLVTAHVSWADIVDSGPHYINLKLWCDWDCLQLDRCLESAVLKCRFAYKQEVEVHCKSLGDWSSWQRKGRLSCWAVAWQACCSWICSKVSTICTTMLSYDAIIFIIPPFVPALEHQTFSLNEGYAWQSLHSLLRSFISLVDSCGTREAI